MSDAPDGKNAGFVYRDRIGTGHEGAVLLEFLAGRYTHSGDAEWRRRIEAGEVRLDGKPTRSEAVLRRGSLVTWSRPPWREPAVPLSFAVLYRDEHLLAVAKPSGLPTLPAGGFLEHTLLARVRRHYPDASPVHRLGRGTSGVLLCARTAEARREAAAAWRGGRVRKVYRALAAGTFGQESFSVDAPIGPVPHPVLGSVHGARPGAAAARTRVRVLEQRAGGAVVEAVIETGRPHQVRIHMAVAGHPLVGDPLYGAGGVPSSDALPGEIGYLLHSERLVLPHPVTGVALDLRCAPPPSLRLSTERPGGDLPPRPS